MKKIEIPDYKIFLRAKTSDRFKYLILSVKILTDPCYLCSIPSRGGFSVYHYFCNIDTHK